MQENPVFDMAIDFVNNTSRHIFLTGKAGTGKTTFLKYIKAHTPKKCVVVAPTGVAAINAGGVTMHSLFQLPLGPYIPVVQRFSESRYTDKHTLFKNIRVSEEKREMLRDLDLVIIDEVSMVRCDTLDAMDAILRYFRRRNDLPFGGVQMLYIGDLFQLPPVMPEQEWGVLKEYYESPFFFHAKAVEQAPPVYIELKKIYRQNEEQFIQLLNNVRNASAGRPDLEALNARFRIAPQPGENYITLTTHNYKADRINAEELRKLPGKLYEFRGIVEGDFPDKTLPTDVKLQLKEGAQVMFIRNDKSEDHRYFNGKIATVKMVTGDSIIVVFADSGKELLLEKETWDNIRYSYNPSEEKIEEEKLGSFTQYPVRLAWAITIHKSQGLTFKNAIIDAGDSFAPGQVYVALSRCTSLDGLILHSKILPESISTNARVLSFSAHEARMEEMTTILREEKRLFLNRSLLDVFDFRKLLDTLDKYAQYVRGKNPDVKNAGANASKILNTVREMQKVALKFRDQLTGLLKEDWQDALKERVTKAIVYFVKVMMEDILAPLDQHIDSLRGVTKIRKYLKQVRVVRTAVVNKINAVQDTTHGEIVFIPPAMKVAVQPEVVAAETLKAEKGSSMRETLTLFRSGMKLHEIAAQRNLAASTIESHLALLVKTGEIRIEDLIDKKRLSVIIEAIRENDSPSITPVKKKLGNMASFGEIRAVLNHLTLIPEQK